MFYTNATIHDNEIRQNKALRGGGLYKVNGIVSNNLIEANTADSDGGGISDVDALVLNNTISVNYAAE